MNIAGRKSTLSFMNFPPPSSSRNERRIEVKKSKRQKKKDGVKQRSRGGGQSNSTGRAMRMHCTGNRAIRSQLLAL